MMTKTNSTIGQKLRLFFALLLCLTVFLGVGAQTVQASAVNPAETISAAAQQNGFALRGLRWVYLQNGKAVNGNGRLYSGTIFGQKGLYVVRNGAVDFAYRGLAFNKSGTYYCEYGKAIQSGPATRTIDNEKMTFDKNGKCTSARGMAVKVLYQCGFDLEKAFNWTVKTIKYYDRAPHMYDATLSTAEYAEYGFKNHRGTCYVFSSVFYELARALGYNANNVKGYVLHKDGRKTDHGWVEIIRNGKTYVCDPEYQYETNYRKQSGYHFMKEYGSKGSLRYEKERNLK